LGLTPLGGVVGGEVSNADGLVSTSFTHNILGSGFALEEIYLRFVPNVLDIVVDHGQRNAYGENGDGAESHSGVSHVTVGLVSVVFHTFKLCA
jgi:hypothetical protein